MSMSRKGLVLVLTLGFLAVCQSGWAQREDYVFAFLGIQNPEAGLSQPELRVLENRFASFLVQISSTEPYRFIFPDDRTEVLDRLTSGGTEAIGANLPVQRIPANWQPLARGILTGTVTKLGGTMYLDLFIHNRANGSLLLTRQDSFAGFDAMISRLQTTAYTLFGLQASPVAGVSQGLNQNSTPLFTEATLALIQGTWVGDAGLGIVNIRPNGTASADLGENGEMRLQVRIENGLVRIRQDEPNAPKMYMSVFPYSIAAQIVGLARPMSWEFRLSADGTRLIGNKFTSLVTVEQGTVSRVDNTYFRDAVWERAALDDQ